MADHGRISTEGGQNLGQNPFASLSSAALPAAPSAPPAAAAVSGSAKGKTGPEKNRGRVDVRRETGNRGGKTVTIAEGPGLAGRDLEALARDAARALGTGARVEDGAIAVQGDQRERLAAWLAARGFGLVARGN